MATVREIPEEQDPHTRPSEHGQPRPLGQRRPRYGQPFFPVVPFGSAMYITATAIALLILAITNHAPLQNPADPLNHEQINPRPEWYFLFLFQILKYFQGPWEIVGTAVIPGILGVLLLGLPFYDRNWSRRAVRRPVAVASGTIAVLALFMLSYQSIAQTASLNGAAASVPTKILSAPKWSDIAGIFSANCQPCHIGGTYTAGLNMGDYQAVTAYAGNNATAVYKGKIVKPGSAASSYLYQVVAGKQKVGARMPFGKNPIGNTDIQNIYNWIQSGAKK